MNTTRTKNGGGVRKITKDYVYIRIYTYIKITVMRKMGHSVSIHPEPPPIHNHAPSFEFIRDNHMREMLISAYCTISRQKQWSYLRELVDDPTKGSASSRDTIVQLMTEINTDYERSPVKCGHSDTSMAITMRHMLFLSKYGMGRFCEQWIIESRRNSECVPSTNTRATIFIDDDDNTIETNI